MRRAAVVCLLLSAGSCGRGAGDGPTPPPRTGAADGANLRLISVAFVQVVQDDAASVPMIAGAQVAANVLVQRSREIVAEVPVVLRLFQAGVLLRADTGRTGGVLGPAYSAAAPSAQFLIPGSFVAPGLTWQVEIDPLHTIADSSRNDNIFPVSLPAPINVVSVPPLRIHFVPITLASHANVTPDISSANVESYLKVIRQIHAPGGVVATIEPPLTVQASFGVPPSGGATGFWDTVLSDVDLLRLRSAAPMDIWYGLVAMPPEFTRSVTGGLGYVSPTPGSASTVAQSSASLAIGPFASQQYVQLSTAHEIGHNMGRLHAPGCNAPAPLDGAYPDPSGAIQYTGFDVASWVNGDARGALSVPASSYDIMTYCASKWISVHNYKALLEWRRQAASVVTRTSRAPVILISGTVSAAGDVTLRSAIEANVIVPASDSAGDVSVQLLSAGGAVLRQLRVASVALDHGDGMRHFVAIVPIEMVAAATEIRANTRSGSAAVGRRAISVSMNNGGLRARLLVTRP